MSLIKISEKIILNKLKKIDYGSLKLINYDGQVFHFGNLENEFTADIKINNSKFYFNIIKIITNKPKIKSPRAPPAIEK